MLELLSPGATRELNGSLASIVDEALVSVISGDLYTCLDAKMENF